MKNTLVDLNNHLFEQLERLNDEELTGEQLEAEIKRSTAVTHVATQIINNAALGLQAEKFKTEYGRRDVKLPEMLENK
jgi:hypothetical protein